MAKAKAQVGGSVRRVELRLNSGMYKNAFTCGIPGSTHVGNLYAAALGAVGADAERGWNAWTGLRKTSSGRRKHWFSRGAFMPL